MRPRPYARVSRGDVWTCRAVFSIARRTRDGVTAWPSCLSADTMSATPPAAHGDDIDVPFISCRRCWHHWGTGAMAPPGAQKLTPVSPSAVGPASPPTVPLFMGLAAALLPAAQCPGLCSAVVTVQRVLHSQTFRPVLTPHSTAQHRQWRSNDG